MERRVGSTLSKFSRYSNLPLLEITDRERPDLVSMLSNRAIQRILGGHRYIHSQVTR